jgi:hypothetical protein
MPADSIAERAKAREREACPVAGENWDGRMLVLGQVVDPQIGAVLNHLKEYGVEARVVDYLGPTRCTMQFSGGADPVILIDGAPLAPRAVVWDRTKFFPNTAYYFTDQLEDESADEQRRRHQLQEVEWRAAYQLLLDMPGVRFLNDPACKRGMLKPVQQQVAERLGLATPPSLVSNDYEAILSFFEHYPDSVLKSLSGGRFARSGDPTNRTDMLMTMKVGIDDVRSAGPDAFIRAPHFFQQRIEKAYEVRMFAHRGGAHAFRVDSQMARFTSVDWRHGARYLPWRPCEFSDEIASAVQAFLQEFNLTYGSFDFIVTNEGRWVFLECNQDGQWTWLDRLADHALSRGLAKTIFETWFNEK